MKKPVYFISTGEMVFYLSVVLETGRLELNKGGIDIMPLFLCPKLCYNGIILI